MKHFFALFLALMMAVTMIGTASAETGHSVTVAVDDDSFTIGPWGSAGAVRDWTETVMWTHLCYRPFVGAALDKDELQMVAAKSVTKVDDTTYDVEIFDNITDSQGNAVYEKTEYVALDGRGSDYQTVMLEDLFPDATAGLTAGETYTCTIRFLASNGVWTTKVNAKQFTYNG